jgi:ATPase subunit of ABC transporter with duplicated ATPase domains
MSSPLLRAQRLSFSYSDAVPVLTEASFQLAPGWTGLVGQNGAGKTTLLDLLAGTLTPTEGALHVEPEGALVRLCPQRVEARSADIDALAESSEKAARRLLGQLRLDPWSLERWPTLSPGERKRWQVAAALLSEPELLLLDEPTNHLDAEAKGWLIDALKRFRGVGVVVSHDRGLLEALTDHTLRLHHGQATLYPGAYGAAKALWDGAEQAKLDAHHDAQAEHRKLEKRLADTRRAQDEAVSQVNAGARMRNKHDHEAQSMGAKTRIQWAEDGLGRQVGILRREAERAEAKLARVEMEKELGRSVFVDYERSGRPQLFTLEAETLGHGAGAEQQVLLRDLHLVLGRSDRVWLSGANGAGKTTLVQALLASSTLPADKRVVLPQDLSVEAGEQVLADIKALPPTERGRVLSLVAALGVEPERLLASASPSPGEARKALIALGLGRHAWVLLLDEPTNHLDLPSIERLEAALAAFPGAILLVTHDEDFARACCTTRWHLEGGALTVSTVSAD